MKKIYTIIAGLILTTSVFAQSPEKISYQAVVRDVNNNLTTNQSVGIQISILQTTATGTSVYVETQTPTTNANGLVSLEIGTGTVVSGDFTTIDWPNDTYFIKTETDPTGGTAYTITGTSQLLSVPYALYAKTSGSSTPGPQGPAGNDGAIGETGPQGPAGNDGTIGETGPQGPAGNDGATGETGPQGPAGNDGAIGETGPQGPAGNDGTIGETGPQGPAGNDGAIGETGPQGPTGNDGATGETGPQGPAGNDGAIGEIGPQGPAGNNGADGGNLSTLIVSTNTTLNTDNQLVVTSGTITITLPANPSDGQIVYIYADASGTSVNPNGKTLRAGGINYTGTTPSSGALRLIYTANKWYVL